ncbi:hypothetical protein [Rhizobium leguminosarum]|uniref:hypothetical protein n=1 Tax=Rhizobium leguminosarum TaxID=384 RepID=UPI0013B36E02|nr:hypothetical protein [Rhizobium leguminosarum]MBY5466221.1 hypothetical protein [Rhizobium leguminosarum]
MKRSIPKSYAKYAANATTRIAVAPIADRASLRIPSSQLTTVSQPAMRILRRENGEGILRARQRLSSSDGWILLPLDRSSPPLTGSANRAIKPAMKTVICIICRKIIR